MKQLIRRKGFNQRKDLTTAIILIQDMTYVDEKVLSPENQRYNCETFIKTIFLSKNTSIQENISLEYVHNFFIQFLKELRNELQGICQYIKYGSPRVLVFSGGTIFLGRAP